MDIFPRETVTRIRASALEALQEAAELYLAQLFEDSLLALYAERITTKRHDFNAQAEWPQRYHQ
ncbi:hypothetical protein ALC57_06157 [Trachymyrmex cornetzi]|uniref:Core Histone H2A/H2B/H3 domain-containing protein n=1 Tax=Trachymyrmex cornetzi TaxID=471704 RepID=A0A151J949_9HYME|nr:hypothetical protein ALC57_06157 [Trachymyrmex cornetzi]